MNDEVKKKAIAHLSAFTIQHFSKGRSDEEKSK
jgi:hypothetical protein